MSFAAALNFGRDAYPKFKRDEIMTGFNLSIEGMKFTFHGKMGAVTGLVLSHEPISGKVNVQWEKKVHLQEDDVYVLHKDGKIVFHGMCADTDPLWTPLACEHMASAKKRRIAASDALVKMYEEPPEYEEVAPKVRKVARSGSSPGVDHMQCPITLDVMRDPVVCSDGHHYERSAILEYMRRRAQEGGQLLSPVTRQAMRGTMTKSHAMKAIIDEWRARK